VVEKTARSSKQADEMGFGAVEWERGAVFDPGSLSRGTLLGFSFAETH
jgi:hypothetical protein